MNQTFKFYGVTYIGFIDENQQALENATIHLFSAGKSAGNNLIVTVDIDGEAQPIEVLNSKIHDFKIEVSQQESKQWIQFDIDDRKFILETDDPDVASKLVDFMEIPATQDFKKPKKETVSKARTQRTQRRTQTQQDSPPVETQKVISNFQEIQETPKKVTILSHATPASLLELPDDELMSLVASLLQDDEFVKLIEKIRYLQNN